MLIWAGVIGGLLALFTLYDVAFTTMSVIDTGIASQAIVKLIHKTAAACRRRKATRCLTGVAGVLTVSLTIIFWWLAFWVAWTLIFLTDREGVVRASNSTPATVGEVIYFAGYVVTTLGNGDLRPASDTYRILVPVAAATGFFLLTAASTFVLSVSEAVTSHRRFAGRVAALGGPARIAALCRGGGGDGAAADALLRGAASELIAAAQTLLCYPQSANYFPALPSYSLSLGAAVLSEAVALAGGGGGAASPLPCHHGLSAATAAYVNGAVDQYLECAAAAVNGADVASEARLPPPPPLPEAPPAADSARCCCGGGGGTPLADAGLARSEVDKLLTRDDVATRRRRVYADLLDSGRMWSDVYGGCGEQGGGRRRRRRSGRAYE